MTRNAFKMKLKPGNVEEYKKRHDEIWPELSKEIADAGVFDYSIFFDEETLTQVTTVKGSLGEVLDELEADHDYLLEGNVFTNDLIEAYVDYKRIADVDAVRLRPHPQEFVMYYGI